MSVFKRILTKDQNLQLIQDNVESALIPIQNNINSVTESMSSSPFIGGKYLKNISLLLGSNTISHGLNRTPIIWVLGDNQAASSIYRVSWDAINLILNSSATTTVSIWVN